MKLFCKSKSYNWRYEDARLTRICVSCGIGVVWYYFKFYPSSFKSIEAETKINKRAAGWNQDASN